MKRRFVQTLLCDVTIDVNTEDPDAALRAAAECARLLDGWDVIIDVPDEGLVNIVDGATVVHVGLVVGKGWGGYLRETAYEEVKDE